MLRFPRVAVLRTSLLLAIFASCGPRYAARPAGNWALLDRPPMLFVRVFGSGPLDPPAEAVTYELCYDFAQNRVGEVRDPASGRDLEGGVADAFRTWKWSVLSSVRLTGGVRCWRERFEPISGADGSLTVRATASDVGLMHPDSRAISAAKDHDEDEEHVAFVDRFEDHGVVYVMLAPRVSVTSPGKPPRVPEAASPSSRGKRLSGDLPHLSDVGRLRFRGNTMQTLFKVCFDTDGKVERVIPELPVDGETVHIVQTLKEWRFAPFDVPACVLLKFDFTL
jgi:hypothetical protein